MSEQLKQELEADTDRLEAETVADSETIGEQEEKPTEGKLEAQEDDESKEEDTVPMGKASLADIVSGIPAPTKEEVEAAEAENAKPVKQKAREKLEAEVMKKLLEEMLKENAGIDNAFLIKGKGLILRVPRDAQEIKNEGAALHHCVGTYVDRVAKGQTHIFFVRRVEEPDTPYFTMEYNRGRVIQCRGSHNCGMPASVKAFVAAFEKLMKEREEKMERKCG